MGFNCGIVGLPNVGKSTLFNAITSGRADASNYPFCTIDPNIGIVPIPDARLDSLVAIYRPAKRVPSVIEFVDIAGLVRGASRGEGLGNQFLARIRDVDAIAHVVRCFDDPNVVHVDGTINPRRDIEVVEAELIFKDLDTVEKKLSESGKKGKSGDRKSALEAEFYARLRDHLMEGRLVRCATVQSPEESIWLRDCHLLTNKPVMYVCNVSEGDAVKGNDYVRVVLDIAAREGARVVTVCAAVEAEVARLDEQERLPFLEGLGLQESGLTKVIHEGYALLGLITFYTAGPKEVHAWTVPRGTPSPAAAGVIHTDFQKGFIRAEIIRSGDLIRLHSEAAVREAGLLAVEGKEYLIQDGDIAHFRFSVSTG
jgi:hypothetical protein